MSTEYITKEQAAEKLNVISALSTPPDYITKSEAIILGADEDALSSYSDNDFIVDDDIIQAYVFYWDAKNNVWTPKYASINVINDVTSLGPYGDTYLYPAGSCAIVSYNSSYNISRGKFVVRTCIDRDDLYENSGTMHMVCGLPVGTTITSVSNYDLLTIDAFYQNGSYCFAVRVRNIQTDTIYASCTCPLAISSNDSGFDIVTVTYDLDEYLTLAITVEDETNNESKSNNISVINSQSFNLLLMSRIFVNNYDSSNCANKFSYIYLKSLL